MSQPDFVVQDFVRRDRVATGSVAIPSESPWFSGHFPEFPILPGVAQIRVAHELLEKALEHPVRLVGIVRLKFATRVGAGTRLAFRIEFDAAAGRSAWRFFDGPRAVSQGEFRFAAEA